MVRDARQARVELFDAALSRSKPVMDNSGATARRYAGGIDGIIDGPYAFRADSTLFLDANAEAMLLVDPAGAIVRVFAPPLARLIARSPVGDGHGHLVLQAPTGVLSPTSADSALGAGGHPLVDSLPVMRVDPLTRRIDTIAYVENQVYYLGTRGVDSCGAPYIRQMLNPLPESDRWVVLSDGTVAVVRARDFHIDWVALDGTTTASPKVPHEWHRLLDSNKVALVDSMRAGLVSASPFGGGASFRDDGQTSAACVAAQRRARAPDYPTPDNMSDYAAPFRWPDQYGPIFADADDNVWIHTSDNPAGGTGPVYLVVNRLGTVTDRIQIPGGTRIAGFGPGFIYLKGRVGGATQLVRARIR